MALRNTTTDFGAVTRALHWATVVAIVVAWVIGVGHDYVPRGPTRSTAMFAHYTLGLAVLAMLAARLAWRLVDPVPAPEPTPLGAFGDALSKTMHGAFYLAMAVIPILGIVILFARGRPLPVFGLFEIASPMATDRDLARALAPWHVWVSHALMALAFAHAAAAIAHDRLFHDRTLRRMIGRS